MITSENLQGETALITGASAGIGRAFATGLARRGANVVLVARRENRLRQIAKDLEAEFGIAARVVAADLSEPDSATQVRAAVQGDVTVLINNAGFATYGRMGEVEPANDYAQVAVNVQATVQMCHAFVPPMLRREHGLVINVSSVAAHLATPYLPVYGASKSFILSYSEGLWYECRQRSVLVHASCPGATETEWFDVVGNREETLFGKPVDPSVVVDSALSNAIAGKPKSVVGAFNRVAAFMPRVVPLRMALGISGRQTSPGETTRIADGGMVGAQADEEAAAG